MDYITAKAEAALTNLTLLPETDTGEVIIDAVIVLEKAFEDGSILYRKMDDTEELCSVRTDRKSCYFNDKKGSVKIRAVETILDDEPYWTILEAIPVAGIETLVANHSASDLIKINKHGSKLAPLNRERLFRQLSEFERAGGRLMFEEHETQQEKDILTSLCGKLELLRGAMEPEVQNQVDYLFSVYGIVSDIEQKNLVKILWALSTDWDWLSCYEPPVMQDVKRALEDALVPVDTAEALLGEITCIDADISHRPEPLVLVGKNGEAVAESLAKAVGRRYKSLCATILDDELMTSGSSRGYSNGQVSQLFTELSLIGKYGVLILHHMEGIESKHCLTALENLICKKRIADSFLGVSSLPVEHVFYLILTNDADRLPDFCQSFKKIVISEYTEAETEEVINESLIPGYAANYGMTPFRLSKPAVRALCAMALDRSAKCVKAKIRDMLGESIKRGLNPALLTPDQILEIFYPKEKQKQIISEYAKDTIALQEKYILCRYKGHYSKGVEMRCEELFTMLRDGEKEDASYAKKVLPLLVNTLKSKKRSALSVASVKKKLDQTHFFTDVLQETVLLTLIKSQTAIDGRLQPILLVGPPGTGKTSGAMAVAKAFQLPFAKIPLNAVAERGDLIGFKDAKEGMLLNALNTAGTYRALLLLDEVDKLNERLQNVLLNILDGSGPAYEAFAECELDLSQTLFLGTANCIHSISEPLRDRFKIVYLSPYTEKEKIQIATQYIIPRLKKELNQKKMEFAEDAIEELVKSHCGQDGVRDLAPAVEELILKNLNKQLVEKGDVVAALGHKDSIRKCGF